MLNKPIALIILAGVLAVGAGTGAYLGVRGNAADQPVAVSDLTEPMVPAEAEAVDATETVVEAPAEPPPAVSPPREVAPGAAPSRPERPAAPVEAPRVRQTAPMPAAAPIPPPAPASEPRLNDLVSEVRLADWDERPIGRAVDPEPKPRIFEDLIVSADSVIGLQIDTPVSSETARIEDPVEARVTRDVMVGSRVAIPAGSQVRGSVVLVEQGGKVKEMARLGVRFHTVVLEDGVEVPVVTETIYRDGKSPAGESVAKIGGAAVGGAILGGILGGSRGAVIGGSAGAAGGTAAVMAGDRNPATFPAGAAVTVRLSQPATVTIEQ